MRTKRKPAASSNIGVTTKPPPLRYALRRFLRVIVAAALAAAASELAGLGVEPLLVVPLAALLNATAKYLRDQGVVPPAVPL